MLISIVDRRTKVSIDWFHVKEEEVEKEINSIYADPYYSGCYVLVDHKLYE